MDLQWLKSDEAKKISEEAKAKAWKDFKREYPFADLSKFEAQTDFNEKHATAEIYLKAGPGFWQSVSGSDRKYWSDDMKSALGIGGFPVELSLNYHPLFPVLAVQFEENPEGFGELFNQKINIFVSPTENFTTKFREIFSKTQIKHTTGEESRSWLSGPKMKYWPQQLNFALWCATTGSGISREIMHELSQQLRAYYHFHVYFTVRRILYQMGGIQSFSALPGDPTFSQTENKYDLPVTFKGSQDIRLLELTSTRTKFNLIPRGSKGQSIAQAHKGFFIRPNNFITKQSGSGVAVLRLCVELCCGSN